MKRFTRFAALALSAVLLCVACALPASAAGTIALSDEVSVSADYDWTRFQGKGVTLNVYNWGEYISNGADESPDVVALFQQLTGIQVNYTTFDSNETMYAKIKSGAAGYDVIFPSEYMVAKMRDEGMLAPLDLTNIPNFALIDEEYTDQAYDPGNRYSVPYMWCTTGIIYNTTMVSRAPTAWADLWSEDYTGDILMFNNSRDAFAIAAHKLGMSINPTTPAEVARAIEDLKLQKPLVQAYVMDEIFDKMEGGEAAVGVYYSGDAITMIADNPDLAWVFPQEGVTLSIDNMCIPVGSANREAAEMFINFMCEVDVGVANCEYIGYSSPSTTVRQNLSEELRTSPIAYPGDEVMDKAQLFTSLSAEINDELDVQWSEMKSYNAGGNAYAMLLLLVAGVTLAGFNIWRKIRKKMRANY
ncbi:MAG: spermidine/putrescine ABC transporter substrate-binding protein [Oscillospiraceae bacterium]|nr:spermidine/putrescine ABC transporter substrate-binding protein [Oscillospiraceae bacterium]